jgi:hypothetical protein
MFITPQQQYAVTSEQRAAQFQRQMLQNQLNAQYDWRTQLGSSLQLADQQIMGLATAAAGSYLGGMGFGRGMSRQQQPRPMNFSNLNEATMYPLT